MKKVLFVFTIFLSISAFSQTKLSTIHEIIKPTERSTGDFISSNSSADGVCKYLGFQRALRNSMKSHVDHYIYYGPDLVVPVYSIKDGIVFNEDGSIDSIHNGYIIGSIKCIQLN